MSEKRYVINMIKESRFSLLLKLKLSMITY